MNTPLDDAFRALANPLRRQLLGSLADHDPETDDSFVYPDDASFAVKSGDESVHLRMCHVHLPMLKSKGLVEWDADDREISKGRNFGLIPPILQVIDELAEGGGAPDDQ